MSSTLNSTSRHGWILYDASCGFCSWWVPFWSKTLEKHGFRFAALQDEHIKTIIASPTIDLLSDIRLLQPDGKQILGADVYRFVMRHIWWATPFYLLSILPGFNVIFNYCYKVFNRNRFKISKACKLAPKQ